MLYDASSRTHYYKMRASFMQKHFIRPLISLIARYLLALLCALSVLACSMPLIAAPAISLGAPPKYPHLRAFDYANPNAKKGGTLHSYALGSFSSLNPFTLTEQSGAGLELIYDTLMAQSLDEPYAQYALVANDVAITPSSVTFRIDSRARFSDGVFITAEDVGFSFDMMKKNPLYQQYYADVKGYTLLDAHHIRFDFASSENKELPLILGQLSILPKHYYMRDGRNIYGENPLLPPLGSGAYKLARYEIGKYIVYERDPNYWARDIPSRKGQFNFNVVRYDYYRDDTAALQAFLAHKYDWRLESTAKIWAKGYASKALDSKAFHKLEIAHNLPSGMQGFFLNLRKPIFASPLVRRALLLAFNFEWSNENLFFSQYERTKSFFHHSIFASTPTLSKEQKELLRICHAPSITPFNHPYFIPSSPTPHAEREHLKQARDLLQQAGYEIINNIATKQGKPLRFTLLLENPAFSRLALRYARNLKLLGIIMDIQKIDQNQYAKRVRNFDYDMIVGVIPQSLSPGNEQRYFFSSQSARTLGSRNYSGIQSPLVDCLIDKLISAPNQAQLITATRTLDRVLLQEDMVIPHYFLPRFRLAIWGNIGMPTTPPLYDINPMLWWDIHSQ